MAPDAPEPLQLAKPDLSGREEELLLEVLHSGWLSLGPMLGRFEEAFAQWLGVPDAVAVSSGTTALHLCVRAQGWGAGDEVLTSPFSFVASANCLLYEGAKPVFCDIDPVTLNMDPGAAYEAVNDETRGILPVHIFGYPASVELYKVAEECSLGVVEDACEALGAVDGDGSKVGSRGTLSTFAFYANKQMTTGEGGMIIPSGEATAARFRSERNQGRAADMGWLDHEGLGYNYRLSDLACALGIAQVERLDGLLAARTRIAGLYEEALAAIPGVEAPISGRDAERRSWFVYPVRLAPEADRDGVIARLGEQGIASKAYLPCIHLFPHLRELGYREGQFPVAEEISARSLALPFYGEMTDGDVGRVCEALASDPDLAGRG